MKEAEVWAYHGRRKKRIEYYFQTKNHKWSILFFNKQLASEKPLVDILKALIIALEVGYRVIARMRRITFFIRKCVTSDLSFIGLIWTPPLLVYLQKGPWIRILLLSVCTFALIDELFKKNFSHPQSFFLVFLFNS